VAATIATQPVADTGAGVSDDEAQRSSDIGSVWLETVGGREYAVRYARPGGWQWVGTWISPDGIPVTTYALTLELCQVRLRLEIAARTGGAQ
jgi:hypothetical protein